MPVKVNSCDHEINGTFRIRPRLFKMSKTDAISALVGLLAGAVLYSRSIWFAVFFAAVALYFVFKPERKTDEEPRDLRLGGIALPRSVVIPAFLVAVFLLALVSPMIFKPL